MPDPIANIHPAEAFMHTKLFSALIITVSADKLSLYPLFTALRIKILIQPVLNMMLGISQLWLKMHHFNMSLFNDWVIFHIEIHWQYIPQYLRYISRCLQSISLFLSYKLLEIFKVMYVFQVYCLHSSRDVWWVVWRKGGAQCIMGVQKGRWVKEEGAPTS